MGKILHKYNVENHNSPNGATNMGNTQINTEILGFQCPDIKAMPKGDDLKS